MERPKKAGPFSIDEVKHAFHSFDLDDNNFIGASELRHLFNSIGQMVSDQEVDEMIRMCDSDGDGQVSFDEFAGMVFKYTGPPIVTAAAAEGQANKPHVNVFKPAAISSAAVIVDEKKLEAEDPAKRRAQFKELALQLTLEQEDVPQLYDRYAKVPRNESGISYQEFSELLPNETDTIRQELFRLFDYDNTGLIDFREFALALLNFLSTSKDQKIRFAFLMFDTDHNGFLSDIELISVLKATYLACRDDQVRVKAEAISRQADTDHDGQISFDEFLNITKKFPNLLFPSFTA
eukprot:TRINITY_DN3048_c0_g1_i5.p1 TRINITY_DN3048_c0_g1~~TRINITY_DN3048_c0_g1_i5.p1  ORF type:complete len:292 (+),score=63.80 TRINITY_DN3048_c0_g1_i5:100-975(+)